jgi:hypothetical protein
LRIGAGVYRATLQLHHIQQKGAVTSLFYPFSSTNAPGSIPNSIFANQDIGWGKNNAI